VSCSPADPMLLLTENIYQGVKPRHNFVYLSADGS
jgi:hypothetical protein